MEIKENKDGSIRIKREDGYPEVGDCIPGVSSNSLYRVYKTSDRSAWAQQVEMTAQKNGSFRVKMKDVLMKFDTLLSTDLVAGVVLTWPIDSYAIRTEKTYYFVTKVSDQYVWIEPIDVPVRQETCCSEGQCKANRYRNLTIAVVIAFAIALSVL